MQETTGITGNALLEETLQALRAARRDYAQKETAGKRFVFPRQGKKGVHTILYYPKTASGTGPLPVLFNMHGGAWIGGDAVLMESFCQRIADEVPAFVVNINYTKADEEPFPYAMEEVADAVAYFAAHGEDYGIDRNKMAVGGHSAGAQLAAGAALKLKEDGVSLACQMLVYPCTDMTVTEGSDDSEDLIGMIVSAFIPEGESGTKYNSPLRARDEDLSGLCPAIVILCGPDELKPMGAAYAKRLMDVAVPVKVKEYLKAAHGFLEVNRPDYPAGDARQNPEQEAYCKDCERYLVQELRACFAEI